MDVGCWQVKKIEIDAAVRDVDDVKVIREGWLLREISKCEIYVWGDMPASETVTISGTWIYGLRR